MSPLLSSRIPLKRLKPHFQEEKESSGKVGRPMENDNPAYHGGGRRRGAELADQIAAVFPHLDSLEEHLIEALQYTDVPANTTHANIMRIYTMLKFVTMTGQYMDSRFRLMFTVIAVALKCVKCGLLMYVLFGDMPWLIFVLCVLVAFTFITN